MPPLRRELEFVRDLPAEAGTLLFGSKCTVLCSFYYETVRIIPEMKMKEFAPSLPAKNDPARARRAVHRVGGRHQGRPDAGLELRLLRAVHRIRAPRQRRDPFAPLDRVGTPKR